MGQIYQGPYAHRIGYHEGYAAQVLADGTHSDHWVADETAYECHQAACECGWRGNRYPAGPRGEELALDEWDRAHLQPLIDDEARQHSIRADRLLRFTESLRRDLAEKTDEHGQRVLTTHSRGLLDAVEQLEHLLDCLTGDCTKSRRTRKGGDQHVPRRLLQALHQRQMDLLQVRPLRTNEGRARSWLARPVSTLRFGAGRSELCSSAPLRVSELYLLLGVATGQGGAH